MPNHADYHQEPEERFEPLPDHLAVAFYQAELVDYSQDVSFYLNHLAKSRQVLELGCGTGRIANLLGSKHRQICGLDISHDMLCEAKGKNPFCTFVCMDMTSIAFSSTFDGAFIAYNTLNLLTNESDLRQCFEGCHKFLTTGSPLLLQLYIPTNEVIERQRPSFQFQIFEYQARHKLIKEIRQQYHRESHLLYIDECFRLRLNQNNSILREDYQQTFNITARPLTWWLHFFAENHFKLISCTDGATGQPFLEGFSSCCLIHLQAA
jgi:SAM-dependent methyltransferase